MKTTLMILIAAMAFSSAAVAAEQTVKCPACGHTFELPYEGN